MRSEKENLVKSQSIFCNVTRCFRYRCRTNTVLHRTTWLDNQSKRFKNFKISPKSSILYDDEQKKIVNINTGLSHKKLLPIFTYIEEYVEGYDGEKTSDKLDGDLHSIKEPTDKKYKKYADANGEFGYEKINNY